MTDPSMNQVRTPRGWTPMAFVASGLLIAVFAVFWIATALGAPEFPAVSGVFGAAGWFAGFLGLLGLYGAVADRSPAWAKSGAVVAVIGIVAAALSALTSFVTSIGATSLGPAWLEQIGMLLPFAIILGFLAFGIGSMRAGVFTKPVQILLILPGALMGINFLGLVFLSSVAPSALGPVVVSSAQAIVLLATGVQLREVVRASGDDPRGRMEAAA